MSNSLTESKPQKWSNVFNQLPFKKIKSKLNKDRTEQSENVKTETKFIPSSPWEQALFNDALEKPTLPNNKSDNKQIEDNASVVSAPLPSTHLGELQLSSFIQEDDNHELNKSTYSSSLSINEFYKQDSSIPRSLLRYKMGPSDQKLYKRRRMTRPFEPKYEIEWQKNQWLQLDQSTNKQIEELRRKGFSRITIRQDSSLKKYVFYDHSNEMDVLLELILNESNDKSNDKTADKPSSITGFDYFPVRRTYWWKTSYEIGKAYLPDWVKSSMNNNDTPFLTINTSNNSNCSLNSSQPSNSPQTPRFSSATDLHKYEKSVNYTPLKYTEPPYLIQNPTPSS